ncbi:MAG: DEAD/DEAH box helicase, partial [Opitutaceae bacterium]
MQLHGPKRVYTRDSLEFWFDKLELEWDGFFTAPHLEAGRELYRTGGIREIELTASDAIVHCRVDKKDEYAVIEWSANGLAVRSSSPDTLLANTIAIAGLHEIEELIADELELLPVDLPPAANAPANGQPAAAPAANAPRIPPVINGHKLETRNDNGHGVSAVQASGASRNGSAPHPRASAPANGPAASRTAAVVSKGKRELLLKFHVVANGLVCEPWWVGPNKSTVPALAAQPKPNGAANGKSNGHGASPTASPMERMKVISLTALAKKSHFHFHPQIGAYLLDQIPEIGHFLKVVLPTWGRSFKIEVDPSVERLRTGVQRVEVEARALRSRENAIDLEWIFRTGEQMIDGAQVKALRAAKGAPLIIPEVGLVALAPESAGSVDQWQEAASEFESGEIPAYLLFSLFNDKRFNLSLSPELEAWRDGVLAPSPGALKLPGFLRPYQRRGVEWMAHLCDHGCHGLLADEMGLG